MAEIKVIIVKIENNKESKKVILGNNKIDKFEKYQTLKNEIKAGCEKKAKGFLGDRPNFILRYKEDDKAKLYFPEQLDNCIWDNPSFEFFKEKLSLRQINNAKYTFEIENVSKPKKPFTRPKFDILLKSSLDKIWKPISADITKKVGLKELGKLQVEYSKRKDTLKENEKKINGTHENIVCNNCFKNNIKGKRFICAECNNFNLCQECEKLLYKQQIHDRKHTLIQVNTPINEEEKNLLKYDNLISKNTFELKVESKSDIDNLEIEFEVANTGLTNLQNCYFLPVRYGDDYLKCKTRVINEQIDMQFSEMIKLNLSSPISDKKYYEGYFRLFTPDGLPFGQVINVKVFVESE